MLTQIYVDIWHHWATMSWNNDTSIKGPCFTDSMFKWIFLNENYHKLIRLLLKFYPGVQATRYCLNQFWLSIGLPRANYREIWMIDAPSSRPKQFNSSPPSLNGRLFADNIFECIFMNEKFCISIHIPRDLIDNNSVLVQVMAWHQTGDKPWPEPMLTQFTDAYMRH